MGYTNTFIAVAEDCRASDGEAPPERANGPTVANVQYAASLPRPAAGRKRTSCSHRRASALRQLMIYCRRGLATLICAMSAAEIECDALCMEFWQPR